MSGARRFAGSGVALLVLVLAAGAWYATQPVEQLPDEPEAIFRFEKEQVVGFTVVRPDRTLAFERQGDRWVTVGERWRPSASMIRRVAHQLHDLTARATVADNPTDLERYGLGPDAIQVELVLDDGRELAFAVGDPNPTSVSWYLRPLPDGPVTVVKKAAVDYYRLDAEAFREDRISSFDAADCERIEAVVDGRPLAFTRVDPHHWRMTEPRQWDADRDRVRRILGAVAALRAQDFVADQPEDLAPWGLGEDADRLELTLSTGDPIALRFGTPVPGSDPPLVHAWHEGDEAVYTVRASVVEPLQQPIEAYRNPRIVGRHGWEVASVEVTRDGRSVVIAQSADTWRWSDGGEVSGATPRRVADAAADLRAIAFHASAVDAGLDAPWAIVRLAFEEGEPVTLTLGSTVEGEGTGRFAQRDGDGVVYEVDGTLAARIEDLFREHGRREQRAAERRQ